MKDFICVHQIFRFNNFIILMTTKIKMPFDSPRNLYLEYDDYKTSEQNEETFVPFLNYPAQRYFTYIQKKTMYDTYAIVSFNFLSLCY